MKKLLYVSFLILGLNGHSQTCITGPSSVDVGTTVSYASVNIAQCADCYDWDINGDALSSNNATVGNIKIAGSDTGATVSIQCIAPGPFTIKLVYFDENGCNECTFSGTGLATGTLLPRFSCFGFDPVNTTPNTDPNLGLLNQFFINGSGTTAPGLTYQWFWRYSDGTLSSAYGLNPQFWEACSKRDGFASSSNPVVAFGVIISNSTSSAKYYSGPVAGQPLSIPGFGPAQAKTCFLHTDCDPDDQYRMSSPEIKVTKNPVKENVNFQGNDINGLNVTFFDLAGKPVIENQKLTTSVNVEKLTKGIYIYIIYNSIGTQLQEGKIIKE